MNIADVEKEKALKAQNAATPAEETPAVETPTLRNIADIEREKGLTSQGVDPSSVENKVTEKGMAGYPEAEVTPEPTFKDKVQNWAEGIKNKGANWLQNKRAEVIAKNASPETNYDLAGKTLKESAEKGQAAAGAMQNIDIPKLKRATVKDILLAPEYEGIRDSLISQAINARGANFMKGLAGKEGGYESAIDKYNKEQAARYSADVANRDTNATNVQLEDINAANKRDVGEILQRADFDVEKELERKGLLYDTETKKQVLFQMINDSKQFAEKVPNPDDRLLLTAYQQYLSGDATALDAFITTYGTQLADKIDGLFKQITGETGEEDFSGYTNINVGGTEWTPQQLAKLYMDEGWKGYDDLVQSVPLEEQEQVVKALEQNYGKKDRDIQRVRQAYENRAGENSEDAKKVGASNQAAKDLETNANEVVNGAYNDKQKVKKLEELKTEIENGINDGSYTETSNLKTAKANLEKQIEDAKLAVSIPGVTDVLNKNVKLDISGDTLNTKTTDSSLDYLSKVNWWNSVINPNTSSVTNKEKKLDAVKKTEGYQNVKNFLSNAKVKSYAYNNPNQYKYAVNNFLNVFGGTAKDYGFLDITW